jgi:hypothetical protein
MISVAVKNEMVVPFCNLIPLNKSLLTPSKKRLSNITSSLPFFIREYPYKKRRLELKSLKHAEIRILIGNGYKRLVAKLDVTFVLLSSV